MNSNRYYVYIYLDPTKPIIGSHGYEPFYVGKGKNRRNRVHLQSAINDWKWDKNLHKLRRIKKILRTGKSPIIITTPMPSEAAALEEEVSLILKFGRRDIGTGPLLNLTSGGETPTLGPLARKHMRNRKLGTTASAVPREKMRASHLGDKNHFFGKTHSEETRKKIGDKLRGRRSWMKGKSHTDEARARMRLQRLGRYRGNDHPRSKTYEVTSPTGVITIFTGAFSSHCKSMGIKSPAYLRQVAQGKRDNYFGWKCKYINQQKGVI